MVNKGRPRQADVAEAAGVSPAVVSLVINGKTNDKIQISAATRQRVWETVRRLGYVPNLAARSLAAGKNRLLGVFTFEPIFPLQTPSFYFPFLVGIEEAAEQLDYNLMFYTRSSDRSGSRSLYKDGINQLQLADGAVLLGRHEKRDELLRLYQDGFPFVYVGRRSVPGGELSYVAADYSSATAEIVRYMAAHGHRRIAYLATASNGEQAEDREAGYRLAHEQLGWPLYPGLLRRIEAAGFKNHDLQALMVHGVTAVVAENDSLTRRVMQVAEQSGVNIPDELSLAILGDPFSSEPLGRDLTTFKIPRREMGTGAVELLVRMLEPRESAAPQRVTLPCAFYAGSTVADVRED